MKQFHHGFYRLLAIIVSCLILSEAVLASNDPTDSPPERLKFGIAPFMSPMALLKRMAPLRDYLSDSLGVEIVIETTTDANEFNKRTLRSQYDFVLTNPTFSLMALNKGEFQIVAAQKKKLSGHFVVLDSSNIQEITDLAGKRIGCPPKVGFMGQLIAPYLRNHIFTDGNMPEIKYFHSHNDAISALRLGETEATLIVGFMYKHLQSKGIPIRGVHRTEQYPGMTILAGTNVAPELIKKLRMSLYDLDQNETGRQVLKKISMSGYEELNIRELEKVRPYVPSNIE